RIRSGSRAAGLGCAAARNCAALGGDCAAAYPVKRLVNEPPAGQKKKSELTHCRQLTFRTKLEHCSLYVLEENAMLKSAMEEVAALTSLALFVSMIAIWAQVIAVL